MQVTPQADKFLHSKLPIDSDEKILAVYKHHWFAYLSSWLVGLITVIVIMIVAIALTTFGSSDSALALHKSQIIAGAGGLSVLILLGTSLPVYLRSQEQVVLTEEALLQILQPSLFASKIDQLNLQHISDVSVKQDFFGTILGYGHITIETPGEQDNYQFSTLPNPHATARSIVEAHENYDAAMQSGRMPSTLGYSAPVTAPMQPVNMQQYQQFLQYQQMVAQQQGQAPGPVEPEQTAAQANDPTAQPNSRVQQEEEQ